MRSEREEAVVGLRELDRRVRGEAGLAVREPELRLWQRRRELDDLGERQALPPLIEPRPRRHAVHVRRHRDLWELLELFPVELDLVQDLAEHAELPGPRVEARHRSVVENGPFLCEVLPRRDARRLLLREVRFLTEELHPWSNPAAFRSILKV